MHDLLSLALIVSFCDAGLLEVFLELRQVLLSKLDLSILEWVLMLHSVNGKPLSIFLRY